MLMLWTVLLWGAGSSDLQAAVFAGTVFEDVNGNGVRDSGEPGIAGVSVSDQADVVVTGADGSYRLAGGNGYGIVFVSVPDGYRLTAGYWKAGVNSTQPLDFGLKKTKPVHSFTLLHASDTHISPASLDRMKLFKEKADSVRPDLTIITGDLIKDALRVPENTARGLYELFAAEYPKLPGTVWLVPGNHEIFGIERHLSLVSADHPLFGRKMYRHYFGPDYYSFNYGGVHFVALNSLSIEDLWYYGNIDSLQLAWLAKDIAQVPAQMPIVTFQHVPFFSGGLSVAGFEEAGPGRSLERVNGRLQYRHVVSNTVDVLAIMKGHRWPLALAGHHHYQQKYSLAGIETRFEQTAAVVGPGEDGGLRLPSGVVVYKVSDGKIDAGTFVAL